MRSWRTIIAGGAEVVRLVDEFLKGEQVSATRGFEEREKPFRDMPDEALREALVGPFFLQDLLHKAAVQDAAVSSDRV
jgi:hypothetical protein